MLSITYALLFLSSPVIGISDGDTIKVLINGRPTVIRLAGIDAPEKRQPCGPQSRDHLASMIAGQNVQLIPTGTDRYGRLVAVAWINGRNINAEMIISGHAWHFKKYDKSKHLAALEREAQHARRGLWATDNPLEPWLFRHPRK